MKNHKEKLQFNTETYDFELSHYAVDCFTRYDELTAESFAEVYGNLEDYLFVASLSYMDVQELTSRYTCNIYLDGNTDEFKVYYRVERLYAELGIYEPELEQQVSSYLIFERRFDMISVMLDVLRGNHVL